LSLLLVRRPPPELAVLFLLPFFELDLLFLVFCLRVILLEVVSLLSVPSSAAESKSSSPSSSSVNCRLVTLRALLLGLWVTTTPCQCEDDAEVDEPFALNIELEPELVLLFNNIVVPM